MKFFDLSKPLWQIIALLLLAFVWGSSFILMKRGLVAYSHNEVATLRMVIAFLCFLPFILSNIKKVDRKYWKHLVIVGLFGNGIPAFLFTKAETGLSSSLTGMLNSLVPLFTIILGVLIYKVPTNKLKFIGVFIGLCGAAMLIGGNGLDIENSKTSYSIYVIMATLCYAISVNSIKKYLQDVNSIVVSSFAFLFIGPPLLVYLFTTDFVYTTINNPVAPTALMFIVILSVFGTALSLIIFNMLVKQTSALFASTVTYLIPIFAIMWGIIDGEVINLIQILGIVVILIGIYFVNKFK
ncbi:MAG: DMT family transporter [Flavobacteriales bacterium]|nr:DMT family transporter [Flavobacteriales bacterium]